jgi:hypothetical protein
MDEKMENILKNLNNRGFIAKYFDSRTQASEDILNAILPEEAVGIGGSVIIDQLGVYEKLILRGNTVYWHWKDKSGEDVRKKALLSDVYLCSANALMDSGELVSMDGWGNRVAAMFYGPKRCIIVCGVNKIVSGYDAAIRRIKTIACPKNAHRLNMDTPCAKTGKCGECAADLRMCRVTVRYSYPMKGREARMYIVGEELGF